MDNNNWVLVQGQEVESPDLITCLRMLLANNVTVYFQAHGYHWNVKGINFAQYHEFFEEIYEDLYSAIDPTAEWLRKLNVDADFQLGDFLNNRSIQDAPVMPVNAIQMMKNLYASLEALEECTETCLEIATVANEQGLINFLGERLDMIEKWEWQLSATFAETL